MPLPTKKLYEVSDSVPDESSFFKAFSKTFGYKFDAQNFFTDTLNTLGLLSENYSENNKDASDSFTKDDYDAAADIFSRLKTICIYASDPEKYSYDYF